MHGPGRESVGFASRPDRSDRAVGDFGFKKGAFAAAPVLSRDGFPRPREGSGPETAKNFSRGWNWSDKRGRKPTGK